MLFVGKKLACQGEEDNATNPYAITVKKLNGIWKINIKFDS